MKEFHIRIKNLVLFLISIKRTHSKKINIISNKILNFLNKKGIKQRDILALESTKSLFSLCSMIACLKGGITYIVSLNYFQLKKELNLVSKPT